jgi:hypothetical protein
LFCRRDGRNDGVLSFSSLNMVSRNGRADLSRADHRDV